MAKYSDYNDDNGKDDMMLLAKMVLDSADLESISRDNLLRVCNASGNVVVAIKMLLNIYQEPVIPDCPVSPNKLRKGMVNAKFVSYDPFNDVIFYNYNMKNVVEGYFPIGEEPSHENMICHVHSSDSYAHKHELTREQFMAAYIKGFYCTDLVMWQVEGTPRKYDDTCSLKQWISE